MMDLKAKAILFTGPYIFFMAIVSVILLIGNPFSLFALLIPIMQIPLGYGLALVVGGVLFRIVGEGRMVAVNPVNNQKATLIAVLVSLGVRSLPVLGLLLGILLTGEIFVGLGLQACIIVVQSVMAVKGARRIVKN